jgi:hypothetical protein
MMDGKQKPPANDRGLILQSTDPVILFQVRAKNTPAFGGQMMMSMVLERKH